jgi:hypothetical protein
MHTVNALGCLGGSTWGIGLLDLRKIYEGTALPQMMYASSIWFNANVRRATYTQKTLDILRSIQARAARIICGAYRATSHAALDVEAYFLPIVYRTADLETQRRSHHPAPLEQGNDGCGRHLERQTATKQKNASGTRASQGRRPHQGRTDVRAFSQTRKSFALSTMSVSLVNVHDRQCFNAFRLSPLHTPSYSSPKSSMFSSLKEKLSRNSRQISNPLNDQSSSRGNTSLTSTQTTTSRTGGIAPPKSTTHHFPLSAKSRCQIQCLVNAELTRP